MAHMLAYAIHNHLKSIQGRIYIYIYIYSISSYNLFLYIYIYIYIRYNFLHTSHDLLYFPKCVLYVSYIVPIQMSYKFPYVPICFIHVSKNFLYISYNFPYIFHICFTIPIHIFPISPLWGSMVYCTVCKCIPSAGSTGCQKDLRQVYPGGSRGTEGHIMHGHIWHICKRMPYIII